jgi:hypothetical protein
MCGNFIGLPALRLLTAGASLTLGTVFVCSSRLFKKLLIRFGILDHYFGPAVQGEQQGAACGFQMLEKLSLAAFKVTQRPDIREVKHDAPLSSFVGLIWAKFGLPGYDAE